MSPQYRTREFKEIPSSRFPARNAVEVLLQFLPFMELIDPTIGIFMPKEIQFGSRSIDHDYWAGVDIVRIYATEGVYRPPGRYQYQKDGSLAEEPHTEGLGYSFTEEDGGYWSHLDFHIWHVKGKKMVELRGQLGNHNAPTFRMTVRGSSSLFEEVESLLEASPLE